MKASELDIAKSIQMLTFFLVKYIQEKNGCSQEQALQCLMQTVTYETLIDKNTKLFCESKEYVLDMLNNELSNNVTDWMKV